MDLPRYRSHKAVRAAKIAAIEYHDNAEDSGFLLRFEGDVKPVLVTLGWSNRFNPKIGGYYVVYNDGYTSWSPAEAFEEGYTRLEG